MLPAQLGGMVVVQVGAQRNSTWGAQPEEVDVTRRSTGLVQTRDLSAGSDCAPEDQLGGDVSKLQVVELTGQGQDPKSLIPSDLVPLHQDAFGLADEIAEVDGADQILLLLSLGHGDGGVRREEQRDVLGLLVEGFRVSAEEVEGPMSSPSTNSWTASMLSTPSARARPAKSGQRCSSAITGTCAVRCS